MQTKNKKIAKLLAKYREMSLLGEIGAILNWDMHVSLPTKAFSYRADQVAYIAQLATEKWEDEEFKKLLNEINAEQGGLNFEERAIVRNLNWEANYYFKVPKKIIIEFSKIGTKAFSAWKRARELNKFSEFLPYLERIVELNQLVASYLGYEKNPYDALLDLYEPELTYNECQNIFSDIRPHLIKIFKRIKKTPLYKMGNLITDDKIVFPENIQNQIVKFVLEKIGYDLQYGGLHVSPHPFTITLGQNDVRITNRYMEDDFAESLMIALHEGGHALYEQGVSDKYANTPLSGGVSLGFHESQSRFWETHVGRSREFVQFIQPVLQAFYPKELARFSTDDLCAIFNRVRASLIRTGADEVTYNLHVMLRFELENKMVNGKIKVKDLPDIWRAKMQEYVGVVPEKDSDGVLQDMHWCDAPMGYFPTYTLGNLYAAQFRHAMGKDLNIESLILSGNFAPILQWLQSNIYQHGSLFWPQELLKKVTGEKLNTKYFLNYIEEKYTKIYSL